MSDIAMILEGVTVSGDFAIAANDYVSEEGLRTSVFLSLYTDRRAEPDDEIPGGQTNARGWWGDAVLPIVAGDKFGSRLWLLDRSKRTADVLPRAESYANEALKWMLDDKVADAVAVVATFLANGIGYRLTITINRPTKSPITFQFDRAWAAEAARI